MSWSTEREKALDEACTEIAALLRSHLGKIVTNEEGSLLVRFELTADSKDARLVVRCGGAYFVQDPERAKDVHAKAASLVVDRYSHLFFDAEWIAFQAKTLGQEHVPDSAVLSADEFAIRMRAKRYSNGA